MIGLCICIFQLASVVSVLLAYIIRSPSVPNWALILSARDNAVPTVAIPVTFSLAVVVTPETIESP